MCGIAGWVGDVGRVRSGQLEAMCSAIRHRGPDEAGYYESDATNLGMRRLSIIDLGGGSQPIANETDDVTVVFNGEIYNFRELRRRLHQEGHRFRTDSDTEVLVHLYEDYGVGLLNHLRGMFAFAIWDSRDRTLLLGRDRLGIKPLYYRAAERGIAFASELKALERVGLAGDSLNQEAISRYIALGYIPDPYTIYSSVQKLPPGHLLTWRPDDGVSLRRYWSPPTVEDPAIDETTAIREIRRLLEESVRYRLISDVPLGAFLSGGLDSTAVVSEMARQMDRPVQTFSIGFDEPEFNEAPDAAAVAAALGTDHHELVVRPDVEELLEDIVLAFDEPFADSSAIPMFLVSQLAANHVKVALSGDGGDELFGGYTRYVEFQKRWDLPSVPRAFLSQLGRTLPHSTLGRNRLLELGREPRARYVGLVADPLEPREGGVATAAVSKAAGPWGELLDGLFDEVDGPDSVSSLMYVDLLSYLPGDILTKVDRMSMAVSLEARVPLLDHQLVEFAVRIPATLKFRDGKGKAIFRDALRGLVPDRVFSKPKQGFGVPLPPWFRGPLRGRIDRLLKSNALILEWVSSEALGRVVQEHLSGRRDRSALLWKLLVLETWLASRDNPKPVWP